MKEKIETKNNKVYKIGEVFATQGMKKSPLVIESIRLLNEEREIYKVELIGVKGGKQTCYYNKKLHSYDFTR